MDRCDDEDDIVIMSDMPIKHVTVEDLEEIRKKQEIADAEFYGNLGEFKKQRSMQIIPIAGKRGNSYKTIARKKSPFIRVKGLKKATLKKLIAEDVDKKNEDISSNTISEVLEDLNKQYKDDDMDVEIENESVKGNLDDVVNKVESKTVESVNDESLNNDMKADDENSEKNQNEKVKETENVEVQEKITKARQEKRKSIVILHKTEKKQKRKEKVFNNEVCEQTEAQTGKRNEISKKMKKEDEKKDEVNEELKRFVTRMLPSSVVDYFATMNETQRNQVNAIGFGNLLSLNMGKLQTDLNYWLVSHYNPYTSTIEFGDSKIDITEDDVYVCLGLPNKGIEVNEATLKDNDQEYLSLLNEWKQQWPGVKDISTINLSDLMKEQVQGGEWYIRNFIVYVVTKMLCGRANNLANERILKCLSNVDNVRNFNWCNYTLKSLVLNGTNYFINRRGFNGPLLVLILSYFDRCVFGYRSVKRRIPLLAVWNKENMIERYKQQQKAGGFQVGRIEGRYYSKPLGEEPQEEAQEQRQHEDQQQDHVDAEEDKKKKCIEKVARAAIGFATSYNMFVEATSSAQEMFGNSESIDKIRNLARDLMNHYPNKEKARVEKQPKEKTYFTEADDEVLKNPELLKAIEEIERQIDIQVQKNKYDGPFVNLNISQEDPEKEIDNQQMDDLENREQKEELNENEDKLKKEKRKKKSKDDKSLVDTVQEEQTNPQPRPKRKNLLSPIIKSPFLERTIRGSKPAAASMYASWISNCKDSSKLIYRSGDYEITVKDIKCLLYNTKTNRGNRVQARMIDIWGHRLNIAEQYRYDTPLRFFFQVQKEEDIYKMSYGVKFDKEIEDIMGELKSNLDSENWKNIKKAKLIFFPMIRKMDSSYYLVCINVDKTTVDIMDPFDDIDEPKKLVTVAVLLKILKKFLKGKHSVYKKLTDFTMMDVEIEWKSNEKMTLYDSGIYCMRHMETYYGNESTWKHGFKKNNEGVIKKLRIKYCGAIIVEDSNELKEEMVEEIKIDRLKH